MGDIKEYWNRWLWPDATRRLITINSLVWVAFSLASFFVAAPVLIGWLAMPAAPSALALRPWTAATYMFTQTDVRHLLVNMLWLYLFGRILEPAFGARTLAALYCGGGLAAAAVFALANAIVPGPHAIMYGASGAVAAVIGGAAVMMPNWRVHLLLFGRVKILWIAVAAVALYAFTQPTAYVGIAHAGGLAAGMLWGLARKKGWLKRKPKEYRWQAPAARGTLDGLAAEQELDTLLDKVGRSGYASLSPAERQRLFDLSQRLRQ